jgi:hypothetical protein
MKIDVQKKTVPQSRVTRTHIATPGGAGAFFVVAAMCMPYEMNCLRTMELSPVLKNITLFPEKTISHGEEPDESNSYLFLLHKQRPLNEQNELSIMSQNQLQRLFSIYRSNSYVHSLSSARVVIPVYSTLTTISLCVEFSAFLIQKLPRKIPSMDCTHFSTGDRKPQV